MEKREIKGLGFYQCKIKNLQQMTKKKNEELKKIEENIKRLQNLNAELYSELNSETSFEKSSSINKEVEENNKKIIELQNRYNLKRSDNSTDNVGFVFQDENEHIIENIKRVISTRRGERVGNLAFGSDVSKYLFMPEMSIDDVIQEIVNSITIWEPRVRIIECSLLATKWDTIDIGLSIEVKRTGEVIKTNIEI